MNLAASMILNFAAIALAITGILNPVVGALVHNVGSVAVIINSSLLLKWREKKVKELFLFILFFNRGSRCADCRNRVHV